MFYDREPLWPWHKVVFDPMHGLHMEGNVLLEESVQLPLACADEVDTVAKAKLLKATDEINELWRSYNFPKYIQFGKDTNGAKFKQLDGPTWKAALRSNVLKKTYEIMRRDVYPLLEVVDGSWKPPKVEEQLAKDLQSSGKAKRKGAKAKAKGGAGKRKKVARATKFGDSSDDSDDDSDDDGTEAESATKDAAGAAAIQQLTYAQRTGAAWTAFISFYEHLHKDHDVKSSTWDKAERERRGLEAAEMAVNLQRAMLALIGSYRRRTYAHDLVYGIYHLYVLYGKPWNASTEGNEHAHQDMKQYFSHLCCHNDKGKDGDVLQVLKLMHVRAHLMNTYGGKFLPNSEYAMMRANRMGAEAKTGKKQVGLKMYAETRR